MKKNVRLPVRKQLPKLPPHVQNRKHNSVNSSRLPVIQVLREVRAVQAIPVLLPTRAAAEALQVRIRAAVAEVQTNQAVQVLPINLPAEETVPTAVEM